MVTWKFFVIEWNIVEENHRNINKKKQNVVSCFWCNFCADMGLLERCNFIPLGVAQISINFSVANFMQRFNAVVTCNLGTFVQSDNSSLVVNCFQFRQNFMGSCSHPFNAPGQIRVNIERRWGHFCVESMTTFWTVLETDFKPIFCTSKLLPRNKFFQLLISGSYKESNC